MSAPRLTIERFRPAVIGENGQGGDVERIRLARAAAIEAIGDDVPTHRMRAPIYTDAQLEALPSVAYTLDQHLTTGGLSIVYGPPGSCKSFLSLAWQMAIATGRPWLNWGTLPGPAIYIAAEGGRGFAARVKAYRDAHELTDPTEAYFRLNAVNLMDPAEIGDLLADVAYTVSGDPALFVFDTMARCMVGGDENSAQDVGRVIAGLDRIREATGAHVLVQHHTQKAGELERGSSALRGAADSMFALKNEDGVIELSCTKQKDSTPIATQRLRLVPIGDSCVLEPLEGAVFTRELSRSQRTMLETMVDLQGDECQCPGVSTLVRASKLIDRTAYRALKELARRGYVVKSKRSYAVTPVGENALLTTDRALT